MIRHWWNKGLWKCTQMATIGFPAMEGYMRLIATVAEGEAGVCPSSLVHNCTTFSGLGHPQPVYPLLHGIYRRN